MKYKKGKVFEPFEQNDDQEMWVGEIDADNEGADSRREINHTECIEVRAESRSLLNHRMSVILDALNGAEHRAKSLFWGD